MKSEKSNIAREIHPAVAFIPFLLLIVLLVIVVRAFGADAMDGGSQVALLISAGAAMFIAMHWYKIPFEVIEEAINNNIRTIGSAVLILFLIGAIAGSWMVSGVVPTMIYYGLQILHPSIFLLAVCLICALVSMMVGSSWSTIATVGVALIGIGSTLGFSPGWTAGAIISGAYFGDKISPLSDTTVLASSVNEVKLFDHIRYMVITTVPTIVIACIVFLIASLFHTPASNMSIEEVNVALKDTFVISPWLMVVPAITGILIVKRVPAILTLSISSLLAGITAIIAQPSIVASIGGGSDFMGMFRGLFISLYGKTSIETGNEMLSSLVQTGGITGMLSTVFLIFCAASFGGVLSGTGMIASITNAMTKRLERRVSIVGATVSTGLMANLSTGDQFLSIILTSNLFKNLYREKGFEARLLSRTTEDSTTVTSVLIPWNSCGMTQSTVLKVSTVEYLPYCIFNYLSPLMSIFIAAIGYKIVRNVKPEVNIIEREETIK